MLCEGRSGYRYWCRPAEPYPLYSLGGQQGRHLAFTQHPKVLNLPWVEKIRRADRDNTIDVYISEDHDDVLANGVWQQFFTEKPEVLTREEKRAWLDTLKGVSLGSDAFFFWRQY